MIPHLSIRRYLQKIHVLSLIIASSSSWAGIIDGKHYTIDDYRNFAENKGDFDINATDIAIYDKNGVYKGTIERVMNFDSAIDVWWGQNVSRSGEGSLVGGPSFIAGAAHDWNQEYVTFSQRFGGTQGTVFYDSYKVINYTQGDFTILPASNEGGPQSWLRDFRVSRLGKIVTEATATNFFTGDAQSLIGQTIQRVAGGQQFIVDDNGNSTKYSSEYRWFTGGTLEILSGYDARINDEKVETQGPAWGYEAIQLNFKSINNTPNGVLVNQVAGGDSGSGAWWYDKESEQWYYVGAMVSGSFNEDAYTSSSTCGANKWAVAHIEGFNQTLATNSDGVILWQRTLKDETFQETKLFVDGKEFSYIALYGGLRGETSTDRASADELFMNQCKNLMLVGSGNNILEIDGRIDTGAGYIQFQTNFTVKGTDASSRLNTAGWVIDDKVTVHTELTGHKGDEWRMIGDGTVKIGGTGENLADLNLGGNLLVDLNRTDGQAVENLKINAGNVIVRILGEGSQIGGNIVFGHRGGVLDLFGHDFSTNSSFITFEQESELGGINYIAAMDTGARIANLKAGSTSTFHYTSSSSSKYIGSFMDDGANGAILNVVYEGGAGSWTLSSMQKTSGTWDVLSGHLIFSGDLKDYHGNNDDYNTATLEAKDIKIASGARLTAGTHSRIDGDISLSGLLSIREHSVLSGGIEMLSSGRIEALVSSQNSTILGKISGSGGISKSGEGILTLSHSENSFQGASVVSAGVVKGDYSGSLGSAIWDVQSLGSIYADVNDWGSYKSKISSSSQGSVVISGDITDPALVDMRGLSSMALGALGSASLGSTDSSTVLYGWTSSGGYHFSGATGELTINAKLAGNGDMIIGGTGKSGIIVLHGNTEDYTGSILISNGSGMVMSGSNVISQINSASGGTLLIRGQVSENYDLTGKSSLRFGTDATAEYSGTLSGGSYLLGGTGKMRLSSAISGQVTVESGTHIWTNSLNSLSRLHIGANGVLQIGDGLENGYIGTNSVTVDGKLVFHAGRDISIDTNISGSGSMEKTGSGTMTLVGTTNLNIYQVTDGALQIGNGGRSGTISSSAQIELHNGASLIFNRSDNVSAMWYLRQMNGSSKVIKSGSGTLTLGNGKNSYTGGTFVQQGTLAVYEGAAGTGTITLEGGNLDLLNSAVTNSIHATSAGSSIKNFAGYSGTITAKANISLSGGISGTTTNLVLQNDAVATFSQGIKQTTTLQSIDWINGGGIKFDLQGTWDTLAKGTSANYTLLSTSDALGSIDLSLLSWSGTTLSYGYKTSWKQNGNSLILTLTNAGNTPLVWVGDDKAGGSGSWSTTSQSWNLQNDTSKMPVAFQSQDNVIFEGKAETVANIDVSESLTPGSLLIKSGSYAISGTGSFNGNGNIYVEGGKLSIALDNSKYSGTIELKKGIFSMEHDHATGSGQIIFKGGTFMYGDNKTADISHQINKTGLSSLNRVAVDLNGNEVTWNTSVNFLSLTNTKSGSGAILNYTGTTLWNADGGGYDFNLGKGVTLRTGITNSNYLGPDTNSYFGLTLSGEGTLETNNANSFVIIGAIERFTGTIRNASTGTGQILFVAPNQLSGSSPRSRFTLDTGSAGVTFASDYQAGFAIKSLAGTGDLRFDYNLTYASGYQSVDLQMTANNEWGGRYGVSSTPGTANSRVGSLTVDSDSANQWMLTLSQASASSDDNSRLLIKNAVVKMTKSAYWASKINIESKGKLLFANDADITQTGVISGAGSVSAASSSTVTLSGINTYSGGTTISGGTLKAGTAEAFGSGSIQLLGGSLDMNSFSLANSINYSAGELLNYQAYAGELTLAADMELTGALGTGSARIIINADNELKWNNSLDWYQSNSITLNSITNNGTLTFDFTGTTLSLNAENSWKLMETLQGTFGQYGWVRESITVGSGYTAGLSDVNGVLSFVVQRNADIDELGNVIGNYTPGAGDITNVNNIEQNGVMTVNNGVNASVQGDIEGSAIILSGAAMNLANTALKGTIEVNGGILQADSDKTVSIEQSGQLLIKDGQTDNLVQVAAASPSSAMISEGFKASTESESSVRLAGSYENASIEIQKSGTHISVNQGETLAINRNSSVRAAENVEQASIRVFGTMINNSSSKLDVDITVKYGGILSGSGIYGNTISVENGGTFKIGNSPGISSVKNLEFTGSEGTGTLDFSINGNQIATTGTWSDQGYSQLSISGMLNIESAIHFNMEIGKEFFTNTMNQFGGNASVADYALILFSNSALLNLGGVEYSLFDTEAIQSWFDANTSYSFKSNDVMALADGTDVSVEKLTYSYNNLDNTGSITLQLKYGQGDPVPEPGTAVLFLVGAAGLLSSRRRRTGRSKSLSC